MEYLTGAPLILAAGVLWSVKSVLILQLHEAGRWTVLFWRSLGMLPVLVLWIGPSQFGGAIAALQSTTVANAVLPFSASLFIAALFGLICKHPA